MHMQRSASLRGQIGFKMSSAMQGQPMLVVCYLSVNGIVERQCYMRLRGQVWLQCDFAKQGYMSVDRHSRDCLDAPVARSRSLAALGRSSVANAASRRHAWARLVAVTVAQK